MDTLRKTLLVFSMFIVGILLYLGEAQFGYGSRLLEAIPQHYQTRSCVCICDNASFCPKGAGDVVGNHNDVLDAMRVDGLKPRLLSRVVPIPVDNDTSHVVPNVVHYVLFRVPKGVPFDFQHYLSFRSASQFMQPQYIFLHGDVLPKSEWWKRTVAEVDNIYHVYRKKLTHINGKKVIYVEHIADFTRLEVVIDYGGIYLDTDTLILKALDPLFVHKLTLGVSGPEEISNAIIIAHKNAFFLRMWIENYTNYIPGIWGYNSVTFGHKLYKLFPHLVHVENQNLLRPTWKETDLIYSLHGEFYNWSQSFSFHVSGEDKYKVPKTVDQLRAYNNTLGQVMRRIYFGSPKLLPVKGAPFTPT